MVVQRTPVRTRSVARASVEEQSGNRDETARFPVAKDEGSEGSSDEIDGHPNEDLGEGLLHSTFLIPDPRRNPYSYEEMTEEVSVSVSRPNSSTVTKVSCALGLACCFGIALIVLVFSAEIIVMSGSRADNSFDVPVREAAGEVTRGGHAQNPQSHPGGLDADGPGPKLRLTLRSFLCVKISGGNFCVSMESRACVKMKKFYVRRPDEAEVVASTVEAPGICSKLKLYSEI